MSGPTRQLRTPFTYPPQSFFNFRNERHRTSTIATSRTVNAWNTIDTPYDRWLNGHTVINQPTDGMESIMRHSLNCFRCGKGISHDVATEAGRAAFTGDAAIIPGKLGSFRHAGCPSLTGEIADDTRNAARAHNRATFETVGFSCGEDRAWKAAGQKPVKAADPVVVAPTAPSKLARIAGESALDYVVRISPADVVESLTDAGPAAIDAYAAKLTARNGTILPTVIAAKPVRTPSPVVVASVVVPVVRPVKPATVVVASPPVPSPVVKAAAPPSPVVVPAGDRTLTIPRATVLAIVSAAYTPAELAGFAIDGVRPDVNVTIGDRGMYRVIAG